MAERMQRLAELNVRVELEGKRELINKAFDQALEKLRALPEDQFVAWMLTQLQGRGPGNGNCPCRRAERRLLHACFSGESQRPPEGTGETRKADG